jgi:hypothetical protein
MTKRGAWIVLTGLISLLFAMPAVAQITNSLNFETTFPFYAGNAKLPAGAYTVTPATESSGLLLLESTDGHHSVFLECVPTNSGKAHAQTDVTFNKYSKGRFSQSTLGPGPDLWDAGGSDEI